MTYKLGAGGFSDANHLDVLEVVDGVDGAGAPVGGHGDPRPVTHTVRDLGGSDRSRASIVEKQLLL